MQNLRLWYNVDNWHRTPSEFFQRKLWEAGIECDLNKVLPTSQYFLTFKSQEDKNLALLICPDVFEEE